MKQYIDGLHHIGIPTNDMDGTIKFYSSFGAEIVYEKEDQFEGKPIRVVLIDFSGLLIEFYEREEVAGKTGAIEHIAFSVNNIEALYDIAKANQFELMDECKDSIQESSYWPEKLNWFIVYGANGEKIEFSQVAKE